MKRDVPPTPLAELQNANEDDSDNDEDNDMPEAKQAWGRSHKRDNMTFAPALLPLKYGNYLIIQYAANTPGRPIIL